MKITFNIDQKAALKAGIDAPYPQGVVDLEPQALDTEQREMLAQLVEKKGDALVCSGQTKTFEAVSLTTPTLENVKSELARILEEERTARAEEQRKIDADKAGYRLVIQALENQDYYEPQLPILAREIPGVPASCRTSPDFTADDESRKLWARVVELKDLERRRIIREIDAGLSREDIDTRTALGREVRGSELGMVPNLQRFRREGAARAAEQEERQREERENTQRALLQEHGSPDQVERYDAGVLPEEEFSALVKDVLFKPLANFTRYQALTERDVLHFESCHEPTPKFKSKSAETLDAEQWARLKELRAKAPEGMTVEPRVHTGWCAVCGEPDDPIAERYSARASVEFAGETYTRLFALDWTVA